MKTLAMARMWYSLVAGSKSGLEEIRGVTSLQQRGNNVNVFQRPKVMIVLDALRISFTLI